MTGLREGTTAPRSTAQRWRFRLALVTVGVTVVLISWGGFVTSIEAGMAVPDWPRTFGSWNPVNPVENWWRSTPLLAEHGHRLLGQVVGALTLALAGWTWRTEPRNWVRRLALGALALVIVQGILGGLRVTENSLALAATHACTAQIFFSLLVALALFTSRTWQGRARAGEAAAGGGRRRSLFRLLVVTGAALYGQIILGALLRHFGRGIGVAFAAIHIGGAFVVTGLVIATFVYAEKHLDHDGPLRRAAWAMMGAVGVQFALGLGAYLVLLNETAAALRSVLQVGLTAAHLVVGALLMASTVVAALLAWRGQPAAAGDGLAQEPALTREPSLRDT